MIRKLLLVSVIALLAAGCSWKYSKTEVVFDGSKTNYSKVDSMKKGEACMKLVMGFPVQMDTSVTTAAKNGKIGKIHHVDQRNDDMVFVKTQCTVVYGE